MQIQAKYSLEINHCLVSEAVFSLIYRYTEITISIQLPDNLPVLGASPLEVTCCDDSVTVVVTVEFSTLSPEITVVVVSCTEVILVVSVDIDTSSVCCMLQHNTEGCHQLCTRQVSRNSISVIQILLLIKSQLQKIFKCTLLKKKKYSRLLMYK